MFSYDLFEGVLVCCVVVIDVILIEFDFDYVDVVVLCLYCWVCGDW